MAKPAAGPGIVSIADFKFGPETVVVNQGPDDHLAQRRRLAASGHDHRAEGAALLDRAEGPDHAADARRRRHLRLHLRPAPGDEGQDRGQGIGTAASIDERFSNGANPAGNGGVFADLLAAGTRAHPQPGDERQPATMRLRQDIPCRCPPASCCRYRPAHLPTASSTARSPATTMRSRQDSQDEECLVRARRALRKPG